MRTRSVTFTLGYVCCTYVCGPAAGPLLFTSLFLIPPFDVSPCLPLLFNPLFNFILLTVLKKMATGNIWQSMFEILRSGEAGRKGKNKKESDRTAARGSYSNCPRAYDCIVK